jgi:hypothetical protein
MKIDPSLQATSPLYKDEKFNSKEQFEEWLNKLAKYSIKFVDNMQDCLEWTIDERGEVLNSDMQGFVWIGKMVSLADIEVGREICVIDESGEKTRYDFVVEQIEDLR